MYGTREQVLSSLLACALVASLVAGCSPGVSTRIDRGNELAADFVVSDPARTWITVPEAQLALARVGRDGSEQKILLPNETVTQGDNFILLRLIGPGLSPLTGRFDLDKIILSAGGVPPPFTREDLKFMLSPADSGGSRVHAVKVRGASTTCVLAFQSLDAKERALPSRAKRLEIMMRNCVRGGETKALSPLDPARLGILRSEGTPGATVSNLSPLARPYQ